MPTLIGRTDLHLRIIWNGDEIYQEILEATRRAVDHTMEACVTWSHLHHDYSSNTGKLYLSTEIFERAMPWGAGRIVGSWGASENYSLYVEIGTSRPDAGAPRAQVRAASADGNMWMIPPPMPLGRHTDTYYITETTYGKDGPTGTRRVKMGGEGPLMEAHMYLRPAAQAEYPLLAPRIAAYYRGEFPE